MPFFGSTYKLSTGKGPFFSDAGAKVNKLRVSLLNKPIQKMKTFGQREIKNFIKRKASSDMMKDFTKMEGLMSNLSKTPKKSGGGSLMNLVKEGVDILAEF